MDILNNNNSSKIIIVVVAKKNLLDRRGLFDDISNLEKTFFDSNQIEVLTVVLCTRPELLVIPL